MDMFSDYRVLFLLFIPIVLNVVFIFMRRNDREKYYYNNSDFSDFNLVEALLSFAIFFTVTTGMWYLGRDLRIQNFTEQIGGFITAVYSEDGDHQESYSCNCTTDSEGNSKCDTCYRTVYHRDFYVETNIGDWFSGSKWHDRVDKPTQNSEPYLIPSYYSQSFVGKAVSLDNHYPNYIAAMNENEYKNTYKALSGGLKDVCPESSDKRITEQSVQKIFTLGFDELSPIRQNVNSWNFANAPADLSNLSFENIPMYADTQFGYLGGAVQADTHIYVVNSTEALYANMCMAKWKNGAKNSIYVFIFGQSDGIQYKATDVYVGLGVDGVNENTGIELENESSRSNEYMKFDIRNQLMTYFNNGGQLEREKVLSIVFSNVNKNFVRQEMAQFKEMIHRVYPTSGFMTLTFVLLLVLDVVVHLYFSNNNL